MRRKIVISRSTSFIVMLCIHINQLLSVCTRSEDLLKKAGHVARDELLAFGTCFGKFTKTSKFRLHITALDFLAPYAKVHINS